MSRFRCLAILGLLAACASTPLPLPAEPASAAPPASAQPARSRSRWVAVDFEELPGWAEDRFAQLWPALVAGCARPARGFNQLCAQALLSPPNVEDEAIRRWLMERLQPYRIEAADGAAEGLITGYYEPQIEARRKPEGNFKVPLHAPPPELKNRNFTREQFESLPQAMATLRGREIAWIEDPIDALVLQIQGSGRLRIAAADGTRKTVRLAWAGHNDQPYRSIGRWLVEQGELRPDAASWPAIKAWVATHPQRVQEMLWANPRVVFFREEPLLDTSAGPRGAAGVALTPGRSIAVDPLSVPHGTPVWLVATEPLSKLPLRRLVLAQDSGSAITGAVRADYFWGWGDAAEAQAARMKQPLRMWALWPRNLTP